MGALAYIFITDMIHRAISGQGKRKDCFGMSDMAFSYTVEIERGLCIKTWLEAPYVCRKDNPNEKKREG